MFKRLLLFGMIFVFLVPTLAQDNVPEASVEAALDAAEAALGIRAASFTFEILGLTTDSTLNCALIEGEELPFEVTAIRVLVIYPDNLTYIVHSSMSGQVVVLCDEAFGEAVTAQFAEDAVCNVTPLAALLAYVAPNTALEATFTANSGEEYRAYGLSSDGGWYQVAGEASLGWIESTSVTISGACADLPVMAVTNPSANGVCFVTPQGGFTNVRARPTTDAERVDRVYENSQYQITALNSEGTWFYIQPAGWVSNTVVFSLGDCPSIPSNDNALGGGFAEDDGSMIDTDTATILAQFECPADFSGYMQTRITIGTATAQVEQGGIPNTLRAFPSVDDTIAPRLGVIQPSRTIDRVIAGPVCNQGFVWWLVEIDNIVAWTAESNASSSDYYLASISEIVATTAVSLEELQVSERPVTGIEFSSDGSRIFTASLAQGFGDAVTGFVTIWDADGQQLARIEEPSGIMAIDYATNANLLAVAAGNGTVSLYNPVSFEAIVTMPSLYNSDSALEMVVSPNGDFVVVLACANPECTASNLKTFSVVDGSQIASATIPNIVMTTLAISRDGTQIAVGGDTVIGFYSAPDLASLIQNDSGVQAITGISFNGDGTQALVLGCNSSEGLCTQSLVSLIEVGQTVPLGIVEVHQDVSVAIVLNPDGTRFMTANGLISENEIVERSATTGQETNRFTLAADAQITSIAYTPDGTRLAVGTADGQVLFFEIEE